MWVLLGADLNIVIVLYACKIKYQKYILKKKKKTLLVIALMQDTWVPESLGGDGGNGPAALRKCAVFCGMLLHPYLPSLQFPMPWEAGPSTKREPNTPKD